MLIIDFDNLLCIGIGQLSATFQAIFLKKREIFHSLVLGKQGAVFNDPLSKHVNLNTTIPERM